MKTILGIMLQQTRTLDALLIQNQPPSTGLAAAYEAMTSIFDFQIYLAFLSTYIQRYVFKLTKLSFYLYFMTQRVAVNFGSLYQNSLMCCSRKLLARLCARTHSISIQVT